LGLEKGEGGFEQIFDQTKKYQNNRTIDQTNFEFRIKNRNMRDLTRAEEEVMQVLWKLKKGFVKEILEHFDEPKPAYNTVSTIVRILQDKGFVDHKAYGRTHEYFPVVSKSEYSKSHLSTFVNDYFSNSFEKMVSFFAKEKSISVKEMEEIMKIMEGEVKKQKNK
jgi:BlaI family transcriptional regulator, penicillinase repressor